MFHNAKRDTLITRVLLDKYQGVFKTRVAADETTRRGLGAVHFTE